ncbi:MAG: peroxidase family protein [Candidatus Nanopelagicales bacterium]
MTVTNPASARPDEGLTERADRLFRAGDYPAAADAYQQALDAATADGEREALQHKRDRARANAATGIGTSDQQEHVYDRLYRDQYLRSAPHPGTPQSTPPDTTHRRSALGAAANRAKVGFGRAAGAAGSFGLHSLTRVVGSRGVTGEVWTDWYSTGQSLPKALGKVLQVLKLAYMRESLFANNLVRTYPADAKTGFVDPPEEAPPTIERWRTADGSWNDTRLDPDGRPDPMVGAAYTRFFRNVGDDQGLAAVHPRQDPGTDPVNVREVSRRVFAPQGERALVPFLNLWAAVWIQFQNHDWVSHGTPETDRRARVPLAEDDPLRTYGIDHLDVPATPADLTRQPGEADNPPSFINEVTHWWDGSQIYGSDPETQRAIRAFEGGRLRVTEGDLLPVDETTGTELTGFSRNWWLALGAIHTLFVREHNAIADHLAEAYPDWDDEALFQTARLINTAVMAKIHTVEWTPAVLPNEMLTDGMKANWYGLITAARGGKRMEALEDIPISNRELGGILGNPQGTFAKYALSEEFTAVYRLHSLLPDSVRIFHHGETQPRADVPLLETRHHASHQLIQEHGVDNIALSMGIQNCNALVANNFPRALLDMSLHAEPVVDLGAIDLFRDRERGVPPYNQLRKELGLKRVPSFDDLTEDAEVAATLRDLYGQDEAGNDNIDDMDLLVGTLCEGHRPTGFGFGETLFQIFILNASWRLLGDRFYTDDYREEVYTREGLAWVDAADMKSVLLRHFPSLADTGLANVTNAFEPWDAGPLDPSRHPLREWDRNLRGDPWRGDAPTVLRTGSPAGG